MHTENKYTKSLSFDKVTSFDATNEFDKSQPPAELQITIAKLMKLEYNIKGI